MNSLPQSCSRQQFRAKSRQSMFGKKIYTSISMNQIQQKNNGNKSIKSFIKTSELCVLPESITENKKIFRRDPYDNSKFDNHKNIEFNQPSTYQQLPYILSQIHSVEKMGRQTRNAARELKLVQTQAKFAAEADMRAGSIHKFIQQKQQQQLEEIKNEFQPVNHWKLENQKFCKHMFTEKKKKYE
ncbi:Hypothetical_protein [Hexamita inflata]|uniref:Hypothetical_protein n=1 Tax=Hexamita inflata TaxID=28002 RepID=A0AA86P8A3_9EUKA|nr:Hypothetical protein HINF_LOCUS21185 [Hexamita inflata]